MKKVPRQYIMSDALRLSIEREELLINKYGEYYVECKGKEFKDMIKDFERTSRRHIELMKDLMIKLHL